MSQLNLNGAFRRNLYVALICLLPVSNLSQAQTTDMKSDRELVQAAVEDYVLGLYDAEPQRIERSVDTTLRKIGYYDYKGEAVNNAPMTYKQLYDLSATWNKDGKRANSDSPKKIEIYEVHDKTASAKLTAQWGIDFMHLYKADGRWKIMNIMWQSDPK